MADSFYQEDGANRFLPTELTIGPWGRGAQHGGPPSALLGRAIELEHGEGKQVARIVFDILRPVPIQPLSVDTRVVRPGKKVSLVEASLSAGDDVVMRASAWLIRRTQLDLPAVSKETPWPGPDAVSLTDATRMAPELNYLQATEWRFVAGDFLQPGPATAWIRATVPLVEGEENSSLTHVLAVADSASGVSGALDFFKWLYINTDLSVYLHRPPTGPWICIDAETTPQPSGLGLASATLYDEQGTIGTSSQSLYLSPR
ncbi:MAG: thioesterase family protein [Actinobacteria bacterium]|nr:thioesterase family protein [Actinomycetota bacterium]